MAPQPRHFLDLTDFSAASLRSLLDHSRAMKEGRAGWPKGEVERGGPLSGRVLAMIFEKPSTRTRVSFDVAMRQLGGSTIILTAGDMQLGRGETIADTARVLSRYVDAIMIRANSHSNLLELAEHATVPVINGLTDLSHPCQVMADLLTLEEHKGDVSKQVVAWSGDGNNVANSWIHASARFGFIRADGMGGAGKSAHPADDGSGRGGGWRRLRGHRHLGFHGRQGRQQA
jgi:ornithine carbamoyltransferase